MVGTEVPMSKAEYVKWFAEDCPEYVSLAPSYANRLRLRPRLCIQHNRMNRCTNKTTPRADTASSGTEMGARLPGQFSDESTRPTICRGTLLAMWLIPIGAAVVGCIIFQFWVLGYRLQVWRLWIVKAGHAMHEQRRHIGYQDHSISRESGVENKNPTDHSIQKLDAQAADMCACKHG